ncbi:MAG: hypothetical protein ACM3NR_01710 [Methanosarcina sp.]
MNCTGRIYIKLFTVLFLTVSFCCSSVNVKPAGSLFPYDAVRPDAKYMLPGSLSEISGLAWFGNDTIFCVQDEKARIYVFTLPEGNSGKFLDFSKDGDYEDIASDGKNIYVLRSDGKIFTISNIRSRQPEILESKTPLSSINNTEGLAWDELSNGLLIACKGSPSLSPGSNSKNDERAVYRFDIAQQKLDPKPFFTINLKNPESFKSPSTYNEFIAIRKSFDFRYADFQPSAIAIHPVTGEIYVLSSTGKLVITADRAGKILSFSFLNPKIFSQPEGLCFSPSGDMFISNEGRGGHGNILKYKPRTKSY